MFTIDFSKYLYYNYYVKKFTYALWGDSFCHMKKYTMEVKNEKSFKFIFVTSNSYGGHKKCPCNSISVKHYGRECYKLGDKYSKWQ